MKFGIPAAAACATAVTCAALYLDPERPRAGAAPPEHRDQDSVLARIIARSAVKDAIAREVIAGRTTLPEAAARFGCLDATPPRTPAPEPQLVAQLAGVSDLGDCTGAELLALQVVVRVVIVARVEHPGRAEEVAARARDQFRADRAAGRFAHLPAVPAE